jgi:hypothetical protein
MMQEASEVAVRSVGENDSPLPWLSTGASVCRTVPEGPCVALTRRSPRYSQEILTPMRAT